MPIIQCPIPDCTYVTEDVEAAIAAALLMVHNNMHTATMGAAQNRGKQKAPKIERPHVTKDSSEETWNAFLARWQMFKRGTNLTLVETVQHLFQCCGDELGNDILRSHPNAVSGTEDQLMTEIKRLAVIPVAISVRRSDLLSIRQDHSESVRSFFARINGKATTCAYVIDCPSTTCNQKVDFTDAIVKDVLITGLIDDEIRKEVLGWADLDTKNIKETVTFIEAKEMARDALVKQSTAAGITSQRQKTVNTKPSTKTTCQTCKVEIDRLVWNKRLHKMIACTLCLPCWRRANTQRAKSTKAARNSDESNVVTIASVKTKQQEACPSETASVNTRTTKQPIMLDHLIFTDKNGWKAAESMRHPTLQLRLTTDLDDYIRIGPTYPKITPTHVSVVTDTGAQSCLWSLQDFYRCGFKKSDLLPVKRTLLAANKEKICIDGAILVRLSGVDKNGCTHTAPVMVYISPMTLNASSSQGKHSSS